MGTKLTIWNRVGKLEKCDKGHWHGVPGNEPVHLYVETGDADHVYLVINEEPVQKIPKNIAVLLFNDRAQMIDKYLRNEEVLRDGTAKFVETSTRICVSCGKTNTMTILCAYCGEWLK